jgi:hypothetical protein
MIPPLEFEFQLDKVPVVGEWGYEIERLHFLDGHCQAQSDFRPPKEAE